MTGNSAPIDSERVLRDIVSVLLDLPAPTSPAALEARERLVSGARGLEINRWRRPEHDDAKDRPTTTTNRKALT